MEKQIENNKLIAEFMGYTKESDFLFVNFSKERDKRNTVNLDIRNAKYHSSWDWLMPVVKQVRDNKLFPKSFTVVINKNDKIGKPCNSDDLLIQGLYTQDIELVYKGVIEFIN